MTRHTTTAAALLILAAAHAHADGLRPLRNAIMQSDGNMAGYAWTNGAFVGNLAGSTNYTELDPVYATGGVTRVGLTVGASNAPAGVLYWDAATMTLRSGTNQTAGATNIAAGGSDSYNPTTRTLTWNTNAAASGAADGGATNITGGTYDAPSRTLTLTAAQIGALTNVAAAVGSGNVITQVLASGGQVVPYRGTITGGGGAAFTNFTYCLATCTANVTVASGSFVTAIVQRVDSGVPLYSTTTGAITGNVGYLDIRFHLLLDQIVMTGSTFSYVSLFKNGARWRDFEMNTYAPAGIPDASFSGSIVIHHDNATNVWALCINNGDTDGGAEYLFGSTPTWSWIYVGNWW